MADLPPEVRELFEGPNYAHLATLIREGDAALELIDRLSRKYTGEPFPMRTGVVYEVEPEQSGFMELPFEHRPGTG